MGVQVTNGQTYEHHGGPLVVYANLAAGATFDLELKCGDGTFRALGLGITTTGTTTGTTNVDLPVPAKLRVLTTGTVNYAEIMG